MRLVTQVVTTPLLPSRNHSGGPHCAHFPKHVSENESRTCMTVWTYFSCLLCPKRGPCRTRWRHLHGLLVTSHQSPSMGCQTRKEPPVATLISIPICEVIGMFPFSALISFPRASPYLLYLWLPHPEKAFLQNDTLPVGQPQ